MSLRTRQTPSAPFPPRQIRRALRSDRRKGSLVVSGALERLEGEVRGESPAEEVGEEAGKDVEEDERREEASDGEGGVRLGDLGLLLELVEGGVPDA